MRSDRWPARLFLGPDVPGKISADLLDLLPARRERLATPRRIRPEPCRAHASCLHFNQSLDIKVWLPTLQAPKVIRRKQHPGRTLVRSGHLTHTKPYYDAVRIGDDLLISRLNLATTTTGNHNCDHENAKLSQLQTPKLILTSQAVRGSVQCGRSKRTVTPAATTLIKSVMMYRVIVIRRLLDERNRSAISGT